MTSSSLRIGVLGAANIVPTALIEPARSISEIQIVAIAARDPLRAQAFAHKHHIPRVHASYSDLLADPEIDAIYNPLPNGMHAEWSIRAIKAGKHVLCEKPFASNAQEARQMAQAATETGLVLSEAFAYHYHPLAKRMKDILASGELGPVQHIDAQFCFLLPKPKDIRFNYALGGGALMDSGCYPASLIRYLAGAEPQVISARAHIFVPQVDSAMTAELSFADGRSARLTCDMLSPALFRSLVRVRGEAGTLTVVNPYHPHWFNWLTIQNRSGRHFEHVAGENIFVLQLRAFLRATQSGGTLSTSPENAIANMQLIDAIYEKAGLSLRGR